MDFEVFPKMARLSRQCVVTEKIDGTNAQIHILPFAGDDSLVPLTLGVQASTGLVMLAGSRTRYITPKDDNFGFAKWVQSHASELFALGVGRHFGEWWGGGIQRGYGLTEKRFSLFNVSRWADDRDIDKFPIARPSCCHVVPTLYEGVFDSAAVLDCLEALAKFGSLAAPGFMDPEGVVAYHVAAGVGFKKTIKKDDEPKGGKGGAK